MADVDYQLPMQLMELLGLRGWEASQPRTYWGLKRPDGMPDNWSYPNVGAGDGAGWGGYSGGYGVSTGGGGGYGTATGVGGGGAGASLASFLGSQRAYTSDAGGAGAGGPESGPGVGTNAQADSFGDFLGSFTTPIGAFTSFAGQALANGLAGRPATPISSLSLSSLLGAARNAVGGGSAGDSAIGPGNFGGASVNAAMDIAQGDYLGAGLDIVGSNPSVSDGGYQGGGPDLGTAGGGYDGGGQSEAAADAAYATGGAVTRNRLIGPNPTGPDDGYAALDVGEHVLTADDVARLGGHAGVMRLRDLLRR